MKSILFISLTLICLFECNAQQCEIQNKFGNAKEVYNSDGSINPNFYLVGGSTGMYGISDAAGNLIVPIAYDMYFVISNGKTIAKSNAKKIVDLWDLTSRKKTKLPGINAGDIVGDNGLVALEFPNKKWGYCDLTGKVVLPAKFSFAEEFVNGHAFVMAGENYGMIDQKGQWVIQPKRIAYMRKAPNLILLRDESQGDVKLGLMDNNGKIILPAGAYDNFEFRNGFVEALKQDKKGALYNYAGKKLTDDDCKVIDYPNQSEAVNGLITVMDSNGFAFLLDTAGNKFQENGKFYNLTPLISASTKQYNSLYAADRKIHKWGEEHKGEYNVVKKDGTVVLDGNYSQIIAVDENLFFTANGYGDAAIYSLQKADGTVLAKDLCNEVTGFHKQYATVRKGDNFGIINIFTGEVMIPLEYVNILAFNDCAISLTHADGSRVEFDQQLKKIVK